MGTTEPIRTKREIELLLDYYRKEKPVIRNYVLILFGLYTALRISDILKLHWNDIYDFDSDMFRKHIIMSEKKTKKKNMLPLNADLQEALVEYFNERHPSPDDYLFTKDSNYQTPLCRTQAFRIIKEAAEHTLHNSQISCHSLRKTFGYHAWKQGTPPALLMEIYNHSSYKITKRYLGIRQDEKDSIFMKLELQDKDNDIPM